MRSKHLDRYSTSLTLVVDDEHEYEIASPPFAVGAYLAEMAGVAVDAYELSQLDETPENVERLGVLTARAEALRGTLPASMRDDPYRATLGPAYDRLSVEQPYEVVKLAYATVGMWVRTDAETALDFWNRGGRLGPTNRAARRRKTKT